MAHTSIQIYICALQFSQFIFLERITLQMMVLCVVVQQTSTGVTVNLLKISEAILEREKKKTLHPTDDLQIISFLGSSVL